MDYNYEGWPKWDRTTSFDRFLNRWTSCCTSRGVTDKKQKNALLAQALPSALGESVATWIHTQGNGLTWQQLVTHVKGEVLRSQVISPYQILKDTINSTAFKQQPDEKMTTFYDRFNLTMTNYNLEAEARHKLVYRHEMLMDAFEKALLPDYRIALNEEKLNLTAAEKKQLFEDGPPDAALHWAYGVCVKHLRLEKVKLEIARGVETSVEVPLQRADASMTESFGQHLFSGSDISPRRSSSTQVINSTAKLLQRRIEQMEKELKEKRLQEATPKPAPQLNMATGQRANRQIQFKTQQKSQLRLPWRPNEVDEMYGFGPPKPGTQSWCLMCATNAHTCRTCPEYCARCGERHEIDVCNVEHDAVSCEKCHKKGHIGLMCIPHNSKAPGSSAQKQNQTAPRGHQTNNNQQNNAHPNGNNRRTGKRECHFWKSGRCWRGPSCGFQHMGRGGYQQGPANGGNRNNNGSRGTSGYGGARGGWNNTQQSQWSQPQRGGNQQNGQQGNNIYGQQQQGYGGGQPAQSSQGGMQPNFRGGHVIHPSRLGQMPMGTSQTAQQNVQNNAQGNNQNGMSSHTPDNSGTPTNMTKRFREETLAEILTAMQAENSAEKHMAMFKEAFTMGQAASNKKHRSGATAISAQSDSD